MSPPLHTPSPSPSLPTSTPPLTKPLQTYVRRHPQPPLAPSPSSSLSPHIPPSPPLLSSHLTPLSIPVKTSSILSMSLLHPSLNNSLSSLLLLLHLRHQPPRCLPLLPSRSTLILHPSSPQHMLKPQSPLLGVKPWMSNTMLCFLNILGPSFPDLHP